VEHWDFSNTEISSLKMSLLRRNKVVPVPVRYLVCTDLVKGFTNCQNPALYFCLKSEIQLCKFGLWLECKSQKLLGMHRIYGRPDIRPHNLGFFISCIRLDIRYPASRLAEYPASQISDKISIRCIPKNYYRYITFFGSGSANTDQNCQCIKECQ
jgi:hypothetical protein